MNLGKPAWGRVNQQMREQVFAHIIDNVSDQVETKVYKQVRIPVERVMSAQILSLVRTQLR